MAILYALRSWDGPYEFEAEAGAIQPVSPRGLVVMIELQLIWPGPVGAEHT